MSRKMIGFQLHCDVTVTALPEKDLSALEKRACNGDLAAREALILQLVPTAWKFAGSKNKQNNAYCREDGLQAALLAACNAFSQYDYQKQHFAAYVARGMNKAQMKESVDSILGGVHGVPLGKRDMRPEERSAASPESCYVPSDSKVFSLNTPVQDAESNSCEAEFLDFLEDSSGNPDTIVEQQELRKCLDTALHDLLSYEEQLAVKQHFGFESSHMDPRRAKNLAKKGVVKIQCSTYMYQLLAFRT